MLPNFLVIGVQRCGTTWLNTNLAEHPDVFMTAHKGVHFFDQHYEKGNGFYEQFFAEAVGKKFRGETEHAYFWEDQAPERIFSVLGRIPMVLSVRQPLERAYSHFQLRRRFNKHREKISYDFEEAFLQSMEEKTAETHCSFYGRQFEKFLEYFPLDQFKIISFDDFKKDQKKTIQGVYGFLGIDCNFAPPSLHVKMKPSTNVPEGTGKIKEQLFYTSSFATGIRGVLRRLGMKNVKHYRKFSPPPLDPVLRKKLTAFYDDDVKLFSRLTGRDFSPWLSSSL